MKIAIPSHHRLEQLKSKTYSLLIKHGFSEDDIYIFVAPECYDEYYVEFKNVILSKLNITDKRNHIIEFFRSGEMIVEMDDDIEDIMNTKKDEKATPVEDIKELFENSFEMLRGDIPQKWGGEAPKGLWGLNANCNTFFATGEDKHGVQLCSIINSTLGYFNDKDIQLTIPEKEDFERVIKYYLKDIPILKRCGYGIKTKYWGNKGGLLSQYDFEERKKKQRLSADILFETYPDLVYKRERKNGIVDIRFRRKKSKN